MTASRLIFLVVLSSVMIARAGSPQGTDNNPTETASYASPSEHVIEQVSWPYSEQEHWVKEPVFGGNLHLVEAGRQNRQTVVLIHGLGYRGILDWEAVIPDLDDTYHVLAVDLPGFGGSDNHQVQFAPQKYSQLINWVVSEFAHGPVVVVGHSMGGAVSLRFAHNYPEQVSRLIMVDAAGILQRTVFIKYLAKVPITYEWLPPYQKSIPGLENLIRKMAGKADGWTGSMLVLMDRMPDIPQLMMSSGLAKRYLYRDNSTLNAALGLVYENFSNAVHEVEAPTHIICGDDDTVAPIRTGKDLANVMPKAQ